MMFKKILALTAFLIILTLPSYSKGIEVQKQGVGVYIFKIPLNEFKGKIKPYVAPELTTVSDVFNNEELNFKLVVNGGFFNIKTGEPISNVVIDGKRVDTIFSNLSLIQSLNEQDRIEQVINRTEFRVLEDRNGSISYDIKEHFAPAGDGLKIKHSLQAGPMLLPEMRLEEESFIKTTKEKTKDLAADVLKRRERTVIGLKKGVLNKEDLYIIIFTKDNKVALNEARDYCEALGLDKAMAFDGGASTSINFDNIELFSATDNQRKVKTFLVIEN